MTIKAWVNPPVSLSLKEIQDEFGCIPGAPTTTTTRAPQISTTTSTSTTTTSTSTTLPPLTFNPSITILGITSTLKSGSNTIYQIPGFVRGPNFQYQISGGPPGATFTGTITYSNATTGSISDTVPSPSGTWTSTSDSSSSIPLGLLTVVITFTPLVGQTILNGNTRTLEITVVAATTTSTSTTSTTTSTTPSYFVDFYNDVTNALITSANEGDRIRIVMRTSNVANGTSVPYTITGISQADLVGSPALSGTFVVGTSVSLTYTINPDTLTEGVENLVVSLGNSPSFLATGTLQIQDTSATQNGTAILTLGSGSIETLTGSSTLPTSAVRLMFRLIGAGGSGGGADDINGTVSPGGSGIGGGVVLGMVDLPATAEPKILRGGLGLGGQSAESIASSSGLAQDYGLGGIGFSFPSGSGFSARGGNGSTDGPRNVSGRGGGGGGATALVFTAGTTTVGIASSGGGGGGGGGSRGIAGGHAGIASGVPIGYQSTSSLNGVDAVAATDDGGGGGGGGGGSGAAGSPGRDNNRGNMRAMGGTSGNPVQNTSVVLSSSNWSRFEYVQPRSTAVNGTTRAQYVDYTAFLNAFGIWDSVLGAGSFNVSVPVYFPSTGTYFYTLNGDDIASFAVDGTTIATATNSYNTTNQTGSFSGTAGWKTITLTGTNTYDIGAIALLITTGGAVVFSTLDILQNSSSAVENSISGNNNYYGFGGLGAENINNYSTNGTNGAIAIYWTTNTSAAWNPALLPDLPVPTFQLQLPTTVGSIDNGELNLYVNGRLTNTGTWGSWSTYQYNSLGKAYQIRVDAISGDDNNFCPNSIGFVTKATWTDWNYGVPIKIGRVADGTTVAKVSIRRKSDNVVQLERNITFTFTASYIDTTGGGGGK